MIEKCPICREVIEDEVIEIGIGKYCRKCVVRVLEVFEKAFDEGDCRPLLLVPGKNLVEINMTLTGDGCRVIEPRLGEQRIARGTGVVPISWLVIT